MIKPGQTRRNHEAKAWTAVDRFAREDVMEVLGRYGISSARRAADTDDSEEIILVDQAAYGRLDGESVTRALIEVLPHTKVWIRSRRPALDQRADLAPSTVALTLEVPFEPDPNETSATLFYQINATFLIQND